VSWIHVSLRKHPGAQEHGDLARVDRVVVGLCPVDSSHVKSVAQDERDVSIMPEQTRGAEVGDPVPGKHALAGDHEV